MLPAGYSGYAYAPSGSSWAFGGSSGSGSGLSGNGTAFTAGNPAAPQGTQVAFLQAAGSFSQSVAAWAAGSYTIAFLAAQRGNYQASAEDFAVSVDGVVVGRFRPAGTSYQQYTTASFAVGAGPHTVSFVGLDTAGGDNTAFLDSVSVAVATAAVPPSVPTVGDAGFESVRVPAGYSGYAYAPAGSSWAFGGVVWLRLGPQRQRLGVHLRQPAAPQGTQVAFLQAAGSFSQSVAAWPRAATP